MPDKAAQHSHLRTKKGIFERQEKGCGTQVTQKNSVKVERVVQ